MNKFFVSGRVVKEPKLFTEVVGKDAMVSFTIAHNPIGRDKDTMFIRCTKYGADATKLSKTLYKGVKILVEGELEVLNDDYGNPQLKINVKNVEIMEHTKAYLDKYGKKKSEKEPLKDQFGIEYDSDGFMRVNPDDVDLPFE